MYNPKQTIPAKYDGSKVLRLDVHDVARRSITIDLHKQSYEKNTLLSGSNKSYIF